MARIRYIKPEFYSDTKLSDASILARYFYAGLFCQLDRQGVGEDDPKLLKREIFPYDDDVTVNKITQLIDELVAIGRLIRFEHGGKRYLYCPKLEKHQAFHKDERPKYVLPPEILSDLKSDTVPAPCKPGVSIVPKSIDAHAKTTETETETGIETETKSIGETAVAVPPNKNLLKEIRLKAPDPEIGRFIGTYVKAFQAKYPPRGEGPPPRPDLRGKVQGQIKTYLKDVPIDRACDLIQTYFQMDDPWFQTKCHDFTTFLENQNKVSIALDTGQDSSQPGSHIDWSKFQ